MIERLKEMNPHLRLEDVRAEAFLRYGKVLDDFPLDELRAGMKELEIPERGNVYVPSEPILETRAIQSFVERKYYGGMSVQLGYCNGKNSKLGGLEYHKGSEINVAITELVMLVGHLNEVKGHRFHTQDLKAFYIPKGIAIEMYQTTLHLAPCKVHPAGFKCVVILPEGTNMELSEEEKGEDPLLFMRNKWLIAHEEHDRFVANGACIGIEGPNVEVHHFINEEEKYE
ncbi:DUF4867 family protein [Halobacillus salinarum]|uniref:DUF4867 family protein n=1 Tax=Halobacillus salinarum TaxID=2932257 RepID=A0ABY4ENI3_9BACI|nr:DUF4867 family protein [Halobacillus salinarum]UOQ45507.1 DUF4867 family protein [Halobacillus salinarum]